MDGVAGSNIKTGPVLMTYISPDDTAGIHSLLVGVLCLGLPVHFL